MIRGVPDLATLPASAQQRRAALLVIAGLTALWIASAPLADVTLGLFAGFFTFYGGAILTGLGITVAILFGQFAISHKASLLVLACGMLFCWIVAFGHVLTYPGMGHRPVTADFPVTSAYLWYVLHATMPLTFVSFVIVELRAREVRVPIGQTSAAIAGTIVAAYTVVQLIFGFEDSLPLLSAPGTSFNAAFRAAIVVLAVFNTFALALLLRRANRTVMDAWLSVPAAALLLETILSALGGPRFTVAWYVARFDVWIACTFLVVALLSETDRLSRVFATNERRLRGIVDGVADALVVVDARGAIESINPAGADLFGFAAEDLRGTAISRIVPDFAAVTVASDEGVVTETTGRDARGHLFPLELVRGRDVPDARDGAILILRDITKRKTAEDAVRHAHDRAVEAAEVKAQFLAMMSHEIRTPINAVVGMSELLLQTPLSEDGREYAMTVRDSAESLLAIVNDILDFSKIEAGHMKLDSTPFAPVVTVENAADILGAAARRKGLSLSTYVAPDVPARLVGDADRLRQVLLNLLGNAVKFTTRGSVAVRASVESSEHDIVTLRFSVTDTGPGIPPDVGERLFEPFRQADESTRRRFGGTGLGLSISRRIVELMGGRIGFDSSLGRGATFWCTIPFPRVVDEARVDRGERLRGARVLIVDEDPLTRQIIDQYLQSWGAIASSTGTGPHALELGKAAAAKKNPFDAIVVDRTAGGDGIAFAARLGAEPELVGIPLVFISGAEERMRTLDAKAHGFAAVLRKPIRQGALHDALVDAITGPAIQRAKPAVDAVLEERERVLVLVAEDNPVNRKLALQQLKRLGYRAHAVGDGREAIEAVASGEYALVLMDCQMPDVDGFEATRDIRRAEAARGGHVPIVAMTANALEGDREACLAAGMDAYLAKPVQLSALRAIIQEFTAGVEVAG